MSAGDWVAIMSSTWLNGTVVSGDDIVDDVTVVALATTTTADVEVGVQPSSIDDRLSATGGGGGVCDGCRNGGLRFVAVVELTCIVWILFSSQLKRGPRPTARAIAWPDEETADEDVEPSALVALGGRLRRHCDARWNRFAFCLSTTSAVYQ